MRLVLWLILFHFGIDFWLFPNFFIDSVRSMETHSLKSDIMDSFKPLISYEKRDDDFKMIVLRVVSAIALGFFLYQLA